MDSAGNPVETHFAWLKRSRITNKYLAIGHNQDKPNLKHCGSSQNAVTVDSTSQQTTNIQITEAEIHNEPDNNETQSEESTSSITDKTTNTEST